MFSLHCYVMCSIISYNDSLVQDCSNSIALAMELLQSCTKPSILLQWRHNESNGISTAGLIACSNVCSGADQRQYQSSVSLGFARGIRLSPVDSPHKGTVTWKMMTSWRWNMFFWLPLLVLCWYILQEMWEPVWACCSIMYVSVLLIESIK